MHIFVLQYFKLNYQSTQRRFSKKVNKSIRSIVYKAIKQNNNNEVSKIYPTVDSFELETSEVLEALPVISFDISTAGPWPVKYF